MTDRTQAFPVVVLPGLRIEFLGNYLASLGLLRLLAREWPSVRIAWRNGVLQVVGGPSNLEELVKTLMDIAKNREWTAYKRGWLEAQKKSRNEKTGRPLSIWQADAHEDELELSCAHAIPLEQVAFNPLLGTGGNAGQREFAKGWFTVVDKLEKPPLKVDHRQELRAWLMGETVAWMIPGIAGASWFSTANKLYNSGQRAYREEPLSPWAMALACEGLPFFAGAASRRLGARTRRQAAFPFICRAAAPTVSGETGRDRGEVWAPIWERPMTLPEVRALFQRGRAEVNGRGANTPAAFAAAIVRRGVDAGIAGFARYALGATTSAQTFEPRHEGVIFVRNCNAEGSGARPQTVERILKLLQCLPADQAGRRRRFVGLRGPIEAALIRVAQVPDDASAFCALLDAIVTGLDRVDRNAGHRKAGIVWEPLPLGDLLPLFRNSDLSVEARLAIALVSGFPPWRPFTLYRFGVEQVYGRFNHPDRGPARWVYRPGPLPRSLSDVLMRSILDWEKDYRSDKRASGRSSPVTISMADLRSWLDGDIDERLLARWLGRFALFDWRGLPDALRRTLESRDPDSAADGPLLLVGLLQPLFDARPLRLSTFPERANVLSDESGARTPAAARVIAGLLRTGQVEAALRTARVRYAMADIPLMRTQPNWNAADPERLLAALLFPINDRERSALVQRWLRPQRTKGGYAHV